MYNFDDTNLLAEREWEPRGKSESNAVVAGWIAQERICLKEKLYYFYRVFKKSRVETVKIVIFTSCLLVYFGQ